MSVFELHSRVIRDYRDFVRSFITTADDRDVRLLTSRWTMRQGSSRFRCFKSARPMHAKAAPASRSPRGRRVPEDLGAPRARRGRPALLVPRDRRAPGGIWGRRPGGRAARVRRVARRRRRGPLLQLVHRLLGARDPARGRRSWSLTASDAKRPQSDTTRSIRPTLAITGHSMTSSWVFRAHTRRRHPLPCSLPRARIRERSFASHHPGNLGR
jgi:hypothetical protein